MARLEAAASALMTALQNIEDGQKWAKVGKSGCLQALHQVHRLTRLGSKGFM
jgi:hypothetical protein